MHWVAVAISISFAFGGCDKQEKQKAISIVRPGEQAIEFKLLHSNDPQEETDRKLVRQWIADEYGLKLSEVKWVHHKYEPLSFEGSPNYVQILKNQHKSDEEIRANIEKTNATRFIEFKPAGRESMGFSVFDGAVSQERLH